MKYQDWRTIWRVIFAAQEDHRHFLYRSKAPYRLTPMERMMVTRFYKQGVPLRTVCDETGLRLTDARYLVKKANNKLRTYVATSKTGGRVAPLFPETP